MCFSCTKPYAIFSAWPGDESKLLLKEAVVCKAVVREAANCSDLYRAPRKGDLVVTIHVRYLGNQILFYIMLDSSPTPSFS